MGILDNFFDGGHDTILGKWGGKIQKVTDPLAWIPGFGDKYVEFVSEKIPSKVNKYGSKVMTPFDRIDETINPVRQIPIVDKIGDAVRSRPGDAAAVAIGSYFAAPAMAGAMGGGAAGAGGAAGGSAAGGAAGGVGAGAMGGATAFPVSMGSGVTTSSLGSSAGAAGGGGGLFSGMFGGGGGSSGGFSSLFGGGGGNGMDYSQLMRMIPNGGGMGGGQPQQGRSPFDEYNRFIEEDQQRRRLAEALRLRDFNRG